MIPSKHKSLPIGILYWSSQITSVSFEIAFFVLVGYWGDVKFGTKPWLLLTGAAVGMLFSGWHLWQLIKAMDRINQRATDAEVKENKASVAAKKQKTNPVVHPKDDLQNGDS